MRGKEADPILALVVGSQTKPQRDRCEHCWFLKALDQEYPLRAALRARDNGVQCTRAYANGQIEIACQLRNEHQTQAAPIQEAARCIAFFDRKN